MTTEKLTIHYQLQLETAFLHTLKVIVEGQKLRWVNPIIRVVDSEHLSLNYYPTYTAKGKDESVKDYVQYWFSLPLKFKNVCISRENDVYTFCIRVLDSSNATLMEYQTDLKNNWEPNFLMIYKEFITQ